MSIHTMNLKDGIGDRSQNPTFHYGTYVKSTSRLGMDGIQPGVSGRVIEEIENSEGINPLHEA
jgi:hypothetical protein